MEETVITMALEPTKWQKILDWTGIKRFAYDEMMIVLKDGQHFYDRPNSKIRIIKFKKNELSSINTNV